MFNKANLTWGQLVLLIIILTLMPFVPVPGNGRAQANSMAQSNLLEAGPTLTWNTFLGSADSDEGYASAVDGDGNVYVAGCSAATWGIPINSFAGGGDAFLAKLSSDGAMQWHTFLGSAELDGALAITLDGDGNIYVAGYSRATWGTPINPFAGWGDVFVAKLSVNGELQWHTFLGSAGSDPQSYAITLDGGRNIYLAGWSDATWGTPINPYAGSDDAFVAKLSANGEPQWHTFLGSADWDKANAIALDGYGNIYLTGRSRATWGTPINPHAGSDDAFVAKLSSNGELQWHTFLGSTDSDYGNAIALDGYGNIHLTGGSRATWGTPINPHAGSGDAFVAKLSANGELQWHTFKGSADGRDGGYAIALDEDENIYVAGISDATWGTPANPFAGGYDAFVTKLNNAGERQWHAFLGSAGDDIGIAIALDGDRNIYVAGESYAAWGTPVDPYAGKGDVFVTKIVQNDSVATYLPIILKCY